MQVPRLQPVAVALLAMVAFVAVADRDVGVQGERQVLRLVPHLDSTLVQHLVQDDASEWSAYAEDAGPRPFMDGLITISRSADDRSRSEFVRDRDRLTDLLLRMGDVLAEHYDYVAPIHYVRQLRSLTADDQFSVRQISRNYALTWGDSSLSTPERFLRLERLRAAADSAGDPYTSMAIQFSMARLELELGHPERQRLRDESALTNARRFGDDYLVCQILGELATIYPSGPVDSAVACIEEGLRLASRHRFPDQIARFMRYQARLATRDGHYALAAQSMADAADLTESMGGSGRLRSSIDYGNYLAYIGCWDMVGDVLRRLPPLQREFPSAVERDEATKYAFAADMLRARFAFAQGDVATGVGLCDRWSRTMPNWNRRDGLASLCGTWSWGLQRNAQPAAALVVAQRGLDHCDSSHVASLTLAIRRARLLEQLGSIDAARVALNDAVARAKADGDSAVGDRTFVRVMRARLRLREGARQEGLEGLRRTFAAVQGDLAGGVAGSEASQGLTVREAVHGLADLTPAQGYGFELEWRSRMRRPAAGGGRLQPARDVFTAIPARRETHLAYAFVDDRLLRWCAGPAGVTLDTLPLSPLACSAEVRQVINLLQSESPAVGTWCGPRTQQALERLSQQLLPASTIASRAALEISPDGPLEALPFEALIGPGGVPLGRFTALSYDLGWGCPSNSAQAAPLILSCPPLSPKLRRRYASPATLRAKDVFDARTLWQGSRLLEGEHATKAAFLSAAAQSPRIYVAGHHLRNPTAPFLGYLPVAARESAPAGEALLEASDLSGLDLSGCSLVVLATCSGGPATLSTMQSGPSLRDAFVDAGAHAVVSSFWDVDDHETSLFMRLFLTQLERDHDPARALQRARQDAIREGMRPSVWLAWSVAVTHERAGGTPSPGFAACAGR